MNEISIYPHNLDAEKYVIGGILANNSSIYAVLDFLLPQDFFILANQTTFDAMINLTAKGQPIDYVTVNEEFKKYKVDLTITAHFASIDPAEYDPNHVEHWGRIVKKYAKLRKLLQISQQTIQEVTDSTDPDDIISHWETAIGKIGLEERANLITAEKGAILAADYFEEVFRTDRHITGIPTGIMELDKKTDGLQKQDMIIIAGRPTHGKTAFLTSLITRCQDQKIAMFSIEQNWLQIYSRMVARMGNLDGFDLRSGRLPKEDQRVAFAQLQKIGQFKFWVTDSARKLNQIRAICKRLKTSEGLDMVMIDYLSLIRHTLPSNMQHKRHEIVGEVCHELKDLAKRLNVVMVVIQQLNREVGDFDEPELRHLAECGDIEKDADLILFLWTKLVAPKSEERQGFGRDAEQRELERKKRTGEMHDMLTIAKQRNGATGRIRVLFRRPQTSYENFEQNYQEPA